MDNWHIRETGPYFIRYWCNGDELPCFGIDFAWYLSASWAQGLLVGNHHSSQWRHMSITASQITTNWVVCSKTCWGTTNKTQKNLRIIGKLWGKSCGFPSQRASNAESVSMSCRHGGRDIKMFMMFLIHRKCCGQSTFTCWIFVRKRSH